MKDLKPCPFCGGKAVIKRIGNSRQSAQIACEDCGCELESNESEEVTGWQWNTRANDWLPFSETKDRLKVGMLVMVELKLLSGLSFFGGEITGQRNGYFILGNQIWMNDDVARILILPNPKEEV